jgi:hypothetical protein
MKLNELPISIQKQINETYESSDEILAKIKKKIVENEFILEINSEECLYYYHGNINKVFYDKDENPLVKEDNKEIFLYDIEFYHFLFLELMKIYLLKDNNNNFYFCKEYYKLDKSIENLKLKKEYFYEKLTRENLLRYIYPWVSLANFSLLNEYFDVDSDNELISNETLLYLYEKEQENQFFSKKLKKYNLSRCINSDYEVKIASKIIDKIDSNPNLEKLLIVNYDGLKDLYDKMNFIEELIDKNIVSFKN